MLFLVSLRQNELLSKYECRQVKRVCNSNCMKVDKKNNYTEHEPQKSGNDLGRAVWYFILWISWLSSISVYHNYLSSNNILSWWNDAPVQTCEKQTVNEFERPAENVKIKSVHELCQWWGLHKDWEKNRCEHFRCRFKTVITVC